MDVLKFESNKAGISFVILLLSMLILSAAPASALAADDNTIAMLRQIGRTFAEIAEKASPAVVILTVDRSTESEQPQIQQYRMIVPRENRRGFEPSGGLKPTPIRPTRARSQGLGFIVSEDGHILTCNNVIADAPKVQAKLADGREFVAEIVGTDPDTDIAVLKIDADELPVLKLGDSDALRMGDWVVGFSNTMGLGRTFAIGLVTARGKRLGITMLEDFVQTSVNLQKGDAGGPLLDLDGNVAGINFGVIGAELGSGISFAIPANLAKAVSEQLIKTGTVDRGFLGIALKDVDAQIADALDLEKIEGVVIQNTIEDSAAEKAGMKRYDVLVEFNGKPIESASRFILRVAVLKPGTQVDLVVLREGQRRNLTVTLGKRPSVQELKSDDAPKEP